MELNNIFGGKNLVHFFFRFYSCCALYLHLNQLYRAESVKKRRGTTLKCERSFTLNGRTSKSLSSEAGRCFFEAFWWSDNISVGTLDDEGGEKFYHHIKIIPFIRIKVRSYM